MRCQAEIGNSGSLVSKTVVTTRDFICNQNIFISYGQGLAPARPLEMIWAVESAT